MSSEQDFFNRLRKYYLWYTLVFILFVLFLALLEQALKKSGGLETSQINKIIGYLFLFVTIGLYAAIGVMSRTSNVVEYYVAGRRVPAFFNGMATAADWMSAASFIGMAGTLYANGFDGLAFILGWTGGYCLVAFLLAPYLRKFGQFTIPDFLAARYGGSAVRMLAVIAAILCSFVYVVAQIYGVGLITSRFTGVEFGVGVFLGLAGILVCSFLGGMRAVTWTQVAQYVILVIAYLVPVVWLSIKQTGIPIPQLVYGQQLQKVTERERVLAQDPKELEVRAIYQERADAIKKKLEALPRSWQEERLTLQNNLERLLLNNAPLADIRMAENKLAKYPESAKDAYVAWSKERANNLTKSAGIRPHATPYPGADEEARQRARRNFMALIFCLMLGTASLPHILMRFYTTPSVQEARRSAFWSLLFIFILYCTAPALAVLVKYDIFTHLVGTPFSQLPAWISAWAKVDPNLLSLADINKDGILQLVEISIGNDIIVLATPEIAGFPYVISGLVAAGGLAAALSTADGLLLTISAALSHDVYYSIMDPDASPQRRVTLSKFLLLAVAFIAACVTSLRPGNILFLVGAAFSIAASALFPVLVGGVFWKRANRIGAIAGMLSGMGVCLYYMLCTYEILGGSAAHQWFGISPISAGVFGVPAGLLGLVLGSLLTAPPSKETQDFVDYVRTPQADRHAG